MTIDTEFLNNWRKKLFILCVTVTFGELGLVVKHGYAAEPLKIYTVNYPLYYFTERIAGEHGVVEFPAPADQDPAYWKPTIDILSRYQQADLILLNGAGYARWTGKVSLPRSRLVNTSKPFSDDYIPLKQTVTHSHGPEGEHAHTGTAVITWLDFQQATLQAKSITEALTRKRPEFKDTFEQNFRALEEELLDLDRQTTELAAGSNEIPLLASHPVYQYLARRYQMNVRSVQWPPLDVPGESEWAELASLLGEHPARFMIWEKEPNTETSKRLKSMGVESVVFDPMANRPSQGDFISGMKENIQNLQRVYQSG